MNLLAVGDLLAQDLGNIFWIGLTLVAIVMAVALFFLAMSFGQTWVQAASARVEVSMADLVGMKATRKCAIGLLDLHAIGVSFNVQQSDAGISNLFFRPALGV